LSLKIGEGSFSIKTNTCHFILSFASDSPPTIHPPHPPPHPHHPHHHPMGSVTVFSDVFVHVAIPTISLLAIAFGSWLWWRVSAVRVRAGPSSSGREYLLEEEQRGEDEVRGCE